jgi:uncharacterized membrane protein
MNGNKSLPKFKRALQRKKRRKKPLQKKEEFLSQLRKGLKKLPQEEIDSALEYYEEYFEEAGPEKEEEAIASWGSPGAAASQILADYAIRQADSDPSAKRGLSTAWTVLRAIFASSVSIPVTAVSACLMVAADVALAIAILGLGAAAVCAAAGGVASVVAGCLVMLQSFPTMVFYVGAGLFCAGAGTALFLLVIWLGKHGFSGISKLFQKIMRWRKTI